MPIREEILTTREACRMLKIGRVKLYRLVREASLPTYRMGSSPKASLRYRRTELMRWLTDRRLQAASGARAPVRQDVYPAGDADALDWLPALSPEDST